MKKIILTLLALLLAASLFIIRPTSNHQALEHRDDYSYDVSNWYILWTDENRFSYFDSQKKRHKTTQNDTKRHIS